VCAKRARKSNNTSFIAAVAFNRTPPSGLLSMSNFNDAFFGFFVLFSPKNGTGGEEGRKNEQVLFL
jgi:hypothetical protein